MNLESIRKEIKKSEKQLLLIRKEIHRLLKQGGEEQMVRAKVLHKEMTAISLWVRYLEELTH